MPYVVTLSGAEYLPPTDLDPSCEGRDPMPEFLLTGTIAAAPGEPGVPFSCKVATEIDGRDGEYTRVSGPDMAFDSEDPGARERWDYLIGAMSEYEPWSRKMAELSAAYYA